jgi:hypothetical protein
MNYRVAEVGVIGAGLTYLLVLGWSITNASYDVWGALVIVPVYGVLGIVIVRRMFQGQFAPLATPMAWGLLFKLGGTLVRHWVGFEAYDGGIDAGRYHRFGAEVATRVWSGEASIVTALPQGQSTRFLENFTAFVYTLTGPSQIAGFVTFSMLSYIGVAFTVKAAAIAVPGLAAKRYAWLCVLFPSVVYWPSSIGKEAAMMLGLGLATYGIAALLTHGRWGSSLLITFAGLGFAALIRPHIAGIWVAGALPALVVALVAQRNGPGARRVNRVGIIAVISVAAVALAILATATVQFLAPSGDEETSTTDNLTQILEETTRRTAQADSSFTPPSVNNPATWPYASLRTLLRPLPFEATGLAQMLAAAEVTALLGMYVLSWRRLLNLPRLAISVPYVTFTVTTLFLTGLAYTGLANSGILTRQKSLIMPLLLLLTCLPPRVRPNPSHSPSAAEDGLTIAPATSSAAQATPSQEDSATMPTSQWSGSDARRERARTVDELWSS